MKKYILTIILVAFLFPSAFSGTVGAYSEINRSEMNLDENLADQNSALYLEPKSILVTQISTKSEELAQNPEVWIKSLYYYYITRLNFADLPYNYIVTRDGYIYKSKSGYEGNVPELSQPEGAILIGYMSDSSDVTAAAQKSLTDLISDLSSKYAIARSFVKTVDLTIAKRADESTELGKLTYAESISPFTQSMVDVLANSRYSSVRQARSFTAEIKDLVVPTEVKADTTGTVKFSVVNKNDFPWFTDSRFIYVSTLSGKKTDMFVNDSWDSFARPTHIEQKTILPGEQFEVTFDVKAGLVTSDSTSQDFKLIIEPDIKLAGSDFNVNFKTIKGDFDLIRIVLQPGFNYTNIRSCGRFECEAVSKAAQGELYAKIGEENGWFKIMYDGTKEGWISGSYAKVVAQ